MRLFIALELPQPVKTVLMQHQDRLQAELGPYARSVRWVEASAMHLTLHFLGECSPALVNDLVTILGRHQDHRDAMLRLDALGAFPNLKRPSTLWCGVQGEVPRLAASQAALGDDLQKLSIELDRRSFKPHLTLGRVRRETTPQQLSAIGDALRSQTSQALEWPCGPAILFQSELRPNGPIYTRLS